MVVTALGFDFTNGFHDTGNAMATSIATGALKPKVAVAISAVANLIGAFLSVSVALTVTNAVVKTLAAAKPATATSRRRRRRTWSTRTTCWPSCSPA